MLKFFDDFNKLHPVEKAKPTPEPEKIPDLTVDDMKKQFEDLKAELLGEIRKEMKSVDNSVKTVDNVDNSVDNSENVSNNVHE